ncbi:MAG: hypothetical protein CSA32_05300 [Desulfobulbus propionicus]|nr:MAG: hypothetical protein CSA32_05300 [Desulfobulbus propionicus]
MNFVGGKQRRDSILKLGVADGEKFDTNMSRQAVSRPQREKCPDSCCRRDARGRGRMNTASRGSMLPGGSSLLVSCCRYRRQRQTVNESVDTPLKMCFYSHFLFRPRRRGVSHFPIRAGAKAEENNDE